MKHDILQKLTKYESDGIFVPKFIVLNKEDDYTPVSSFLMSSSFFIFAFHKPVQVIIRRLSFSIINS